MSASLENSTVATEMEKISFHSNLKEGQSQRRFKLYNFIYFMLARLFSKSFKPGFSNTRTENFQMYKLGFREAEEPEIKLSTFVGSPRKQEFQKDSCFIDYKEAFDCVDHNQL